MPISTSTCDKASSSAPVETAAGARRCRYEFDLAGPGDDESLRRVLAKTSMPGTISLSFHREPSFYAASVVEGDFRQVVACRQASSGEIVGFGCRSISTRYINGEPARIGYLSQLRLLREHRRQGLIARGYRLFRELHGDGRTPIYLTTIADDNRVALDQLTSQRAGLPAYHDAGRYLTLVLNPRRLASYRLLPQVEVRRATLADRVELFRFLHAEGPARQFFPVVSEVDLFAPGGIFRDLAVEDFWLARDRDELVGCVGIWNQRAFRQHRIDGYQGALRWTRPFYNLAAPALGWPHLPSPGTMLRANFAALPVTRGHNPALLLAMLRQASSDGAHPGEHLLLGVHERDPWRATLAELYSFHYTTRLFLVSFQDEEEFRRQIDDRPPYLELGCL